MLKIVQVKNHNDLLKFIKFKTKLYKGSPYCVPPLTMDEVFLLTPSKNPSFEFCEAVQFLCYEDEKIVGRICAFINHRANQTWKQKHGRFGWYDFVERADVAQLLMDSAMAWLRERGMDALAGPLGFTDLDHEGMLVEGFDKVGTMATLYNHPYYPQYMQNMGFTEDASWVEYKVFVPEVLQERFAKMSTIVLQRNNLRELQFTSAKQLIRDGWGRKLFELINASYTSLYGFTPLSEKQIKHYIKQYVPLLRLELISLVADSNDRLIGIGVVLPSMSKALQKSQGQIFPFGMFSLLKALKAKKVKVCDLMLLAIHPDYQNKGVNAIIFASIIRVFQKLGTQYVESNPELEGNDKMRSQWDGFDYEQHKRRVAFIKKI